MVTVQMLLYEEVRISNARTRSNQSPSLHRLRVDTELVVLSTLILLDLNAKREETSILAQPLQCGCFSVGTAG